MDGREWYNVIIQDMTKIVPFIEEYYKIYENGKSILSIKGTIEKHSKELPVYFEQYFTHLQIINAILEYFETEFNKTHAKYYRQYLEKYPKALTTKDIERYIAGEQEIIDNKNLITEISLLRNIFVSFTRALDNKSYQLNNLVKLRTAGLDDATIE